MLRLSLRLVMVVVPGYLRRGWQIRRRGMKGHRRDRRRRRRLRWLWGRREWQVRSRRRGWGHVVVLRGHVPRKRQFRRGRRGRTTDRHLVDLASLAVASAANWPSTGRDREPLAANGRRRTGVTALGWSRRRRGTVICHGPSGAAPGLGSRCTEGLQIDRLTVFLISLPHKLRIVYRWGSGLNTAAGGGRNQGLTQTTSIAQSPRTIWTSPPLWGLTNVARVTFSGRGGPLLWAPRKKEDRSEGGIVNSRSVSCTCSSVDRRWNRR